MTSFLLRRMAPSMRRVKERVLSTYHDRCASCLDQARDALSLWPGFDSHAREYLHLRVWVHAARDGLQGLFRALGRRKHLARALPEEQRNADSVELAHVARRAQQKANGANNF